MMQASSQPVMMSLLLQEIKDMYKADLKHHVAQTLKNINETGWSKGARQFCQLAQRRYLHFWPDLQTTRLLIITTLCYTLIQNM